MSENKVIKELGLEDFLLNSSQDDRSNSSLSYGKKSHVYDQEIEKPREIAIDNKYQAESPIQKKIMDIPGIRVFGSPGTPSVFQKKPINDLSDRKFGENMASQESKTSPVQNDHLVQDQWTFGDSNVEVNNKMEPKMEEEGFRKKRTNSFDEEDFDAMDMILEEAKKSLNGDNSVQMNGAEAEEEQKSLDISPPSVGLSSIKKTAAANVPTQKEEFSFQTASMKPITYDQKKLDSFKSLFEENSQNGDSIGFSSINQTATANAPTQKEEFSFQTASMKPVTYDTKKTGCFKDMFEDNSPENSQAEKPDGFITAGKEAAANIPTQKEEFSFQFQTSSSKPITCDPRKLDSFKNLFEDDGNSQDDFGFTTAGKNEATTTNEVLSFGTIKEPADGQNLFFSTAPMKPIKIDTKRLDLFKDMFEGNSQGGDFGFSTVKQTAAANAPTQKEEFSFKTASMKPKKLDSFKNLFEENSSGENSQNGDFGFTKATAHVTTEKEEFSFKTASMKPKKLDSFKNLFEENSSGENSENGDFGFTKATAHVPTEKEDLSFKTASMKPIAFDTTKLQSFKNIFEDDFDDGEDMVQFGNAGGASNDMPVFMTASRKAIPVDMEKIKFAENLLKDEGSSDGGEKSKKVTFKTAKNNKDEEPMIQTASRKQQVEEIPGSF